MEIKRITLSFSYCLLVLTIIQLFSYTHAQWGDRDDSSDSSDDDDNRGGRVAGNAWNRRSENRRGRMENRWDRQEDLRGNRRDNPRVRLNDRWDNNGLGQRRWDRDDDDDRRRRGGNNIWRRDDDDDMRRRRGNNVWRRDDDRSDDDDDRPLIRNSLQRQPRRQQIRGFTNAWQNRRFTN